MRFIKGRDSSRVAGRSRTYRAGGSRVLRAAGAAGLLAAASLLVAMLAAPGAGATTTTKYYDVSTSTTGPIYAGVPSPVTVTLTNDLQSTQPFGSAELSIENLPVSAVSFAQPTAAGWSAAFVTGSDPAVIELTSLKGDELSPGASVSIDLTLSPPSAASITIGTEVKQSNNFNGSGNDFILVGSDPSIQVESLGLQFATQPTTVQASTPPKSFSYMCPPVAVQLVDASGAPVAAAGIEVSLSPAAGSDPGLYYGTSSSTSVTVATDAGGLATFGTCSSGLAATTAGAGYVLDASSPVDESSTGALNLVPSQPFDVAQFLQNCSPTAPCSATVTSAATGTTATVDPANTSSFQLLTSFGYGDSLTCDSLVASAAADPLVVQTTASGTAAAVSGTVTMTFPKAIVNTVPDNGTPHMPVCIGATEPFPGSNSSPLTNATEPYQGLIYDCSSSTYQTDISALQSSGAAYLAVCVSSYSKHAGNETLVLTESSLGDPVHW